MHVTCLCKLAVLSAKRCTLNVLMPWYARRRLVQVTTLTHTAAKVHWHNLCSVKSFPGLRGPAGYFSAQIRGRNCRWLWTSNAKTESGVSNLLATVNHMHRTLHQHLLFFCCFCKPNLCSCTHRFPSSINQHRGTSPRNDSIETKVIHTKPSPPPHQFHATCCIAPFLCASTVILRTVVSWDL